MTRANLSLSCAFIALLATPLWAQTYTPTSYKITLYKVEMSTDGDTYVTVFEDSSGLAVDLADSTSFSDAFGNDAEVTAGTYDWIRMTVGTDLVWSYPSAPISLSDQTMTVTDGPPGPTAGQMLVYFATYDQGGRPNGRGGGQGTAAAPFLLGSAAEIAKGTSTTVRVVFAVANTLQDQGGSVYDLQPPQMFFVTENASSATLSGTFNSVVYNAVKEFSESGGSYTATDWNYCSGKGLLTFDGSGNWSWVGTTNEFDLMGGATGSLDGSSSFAGRYGVNADGSFWMTASGEPGTLQGAISSDDSIVVATMYDSPSSHLMIFGVASTTAGATSNLSGSYYYTTYGNSYNSGATSLGYGAGFGVVTASSGGSISGTSDSNAMSITDPTGTPSFSGPTSSTGSAFSDTLTVNADGTMTNSGGDLGGGLLEDGSAACIAFNFAGSYSAENKFGFLVQQSASGTFTDASLNGTYFGGFFGDVYDSGSSESWYFSGFFRIVFDGAGTAVVTTVENREGAISTVSFPQLYSVDSTTGIVTFTDPVTSQAGYIKGAIGPGARSFILTTAVTFGGSASEQRFLGLGVEQ